MATLKDLSQRLGLSVTQVSRALNGHGDVSEDTRERVLSAAKALNYHPNISARKLVSGRSGIVGLVLPDNPIHTMDGLFVQMICGLSRSFAARGMQFVLHMADPKEDFVRVHERLINGGSLDGFVVVEPLEEDRRITFLQKRDVPFVLHGRHQPNPDYAYFDIDNHFVGYALTRVLAQAGHRRIAFLNGNQGHSYVMQRRSGYEQALREFGCEMRPELHLCADMIDSFGLLSTVRMFQDGGLRPTAIVCGNTLIAKGVFDGLAALGLRVPEDVSLVAHDDILPVVNTPAFAVPLTVTKAALSESWPQLADILGGRIEGQDLNQLQRVMQPTLIERASVLPPTAAV